MRKLTIFLFSLCLFACSNSMTFPEGDVPFIEYEYGSYGIDFIYNLYSINITINGDGTGKISTPINEDIGIDENAPRTIEFEVDEEAIESLQREIKSSDFFSLPDGLSQVNVLDGGYQYITVYTTEQTKKVGGSNPEEKTIDILSNQILEMIPENKIDIFRENIKEYQREQGFIE